MSDEFKLLMAFIEASGYSVTIIYKHPVTGSICNNPLNPNLKYKPVKDFIVSKYTDLRSTNPQPKE